MNERDREIFFRNELLNWYDRSEKRFLPWKLDHDAYSIWLSEIILQQTRVEQGTPYYLKFKDNFPAISDLANASEDHVLKLWEGLGYYSRAKNLHQTAKFIHEKLGGQFPDCFEDLRKLKGIGDYTAAAIASFAYNKAHAVLDGNVFRVLSRFFNIETAIDSTTGKKEFNHLANNLIDRERASDYNQAIMDFGATVCKPASPDCKNCPLNHHCLALELNKINNLPIKSKKLIKKDRYFYYFVWKNSKNQSVIKKRSEKDIWKGLYDFPMIETSEPFRSDEELVNTFSKKYFDNNFSINFKFPKIKTSSTYKQLLTHQKILAIFVEIKDEIPELFQNNMEYQLIDLKKITNFAFPRLINHFLDEFEK